MEQSATIDSGLLLTFDIPERDQVSPFSSVIRLTWRRLLRWSADICIGLCNSLNLDFCKVPLQLCDGSTLIHDICSSSSSISRQRNSGYRPSRVNIMAQGLSTPDPSLSPTHLSIRRGSTTTTHYTHHQVILMVLHNTTLVPSLGLRIRTACEAGLSTGMQREHVPPQRRKMNLQPHRRNGRQQ